MKYRIHEIQVFGKFSISVFVYFILLRYLSCLLCVDMLDAVYADSLPSKPAFCCLNEVFDTLHSNAVPYHKNTRLMLNRLHT